MFASLYTFTNQLRSAYQLAKKHNVSSSSAKTRSLGPSAYTSPVHEAGIAEIAFALLGVKENTVGWLSYSGGWLTGVVFLLLWRKNPFVRLHAVQSIILFGFISILE